MSSCPFTVILKTRIGSHCHGTNMANSDDDIRAIFIPTLDYFFGIKNIETIDEKCDGKDIEYWNITKLVRLCVKGNPSSLNILFADKKDQLYANDYGKLILEFRDNFLSKRTITACVGYCVSQIHKLTIGRGAKEGKRALLIDEFGYDTKFAYHAVMMTNMAIELIKTGRFNPLRKPSEIEYLKAVRLGTVTADDVLKQVESNLKTIKTIESICKLPDSPDEVKINKFITDLIQDYFKENYKWLS